MAGLTISNLRFGPATATAIAALAGGVIAIAVLFLSGDRLLVSQFDTAFENRPAREHKAEATSADSHASKGQRVTVPVAAPESFWLGDIRDTPATLAKYTKSLRPLPGDEVTLSLMGRERRLEITSVKDLSEHPDVARALGLAATSLRLITLRDTRAAHGPPVLLLMDGSGAVVEGSPVPHSPHAL